MSKPISECTVMELCSELQGRPDVIAVKVWTVSDVMEAAEDWVSNHEIVLDDDEWDELKRRAMSEGAGRMESALSDCTDSEWDSVYEFARVEIDDIVKSRKSPGGDPGREEE